MQRVKAIKALPGFQEGAVFSLDENSAAFHKERGDVEYVDDDAASTELFTHAAGGRGNASIVQVAAADYPNPSTGTGEIDAEPSEVLVVEPSDGGEQVVGEPADGEQGEDGEVVDGQGQVHTGVLTVPEPPAKSANKSDLVAYAVQNGFIGDDGVRYPVTEAEAEELTKPELVARLGL